MKHTLGPCKTVTEKGGVTYIMRGEKYLATMNVDTECCSECKRWADLFTAAPEMVKLLNHYLDNRKSIGNRERWIDLDKQARALLTRIGGK